MATIKELVGTRTSLTVTGLSTLASATYVASAAFDCSTTQGIDVVFEVTVATTNTPSGNKKVDIFFTESVDGTNFRSGPTSGTTTTREPNLLFAGTVPLTTASTTEIATFSLKAALGYVPKSVKMVLKNDLGVALTTGTVYTAEITSTVA